MTQQQFELLNQTEQDEEVLNQGVYLINYDQGNIMCDVYKLYHFFVKFCYDLNENTDPKITAFTGTDDFHLYESKIFHFSGN
ncbi:MAG: hypothetical protein WKF97_14540 [Chitinophagaceae bacterium]